MGSKLTKNITIDNKLAINPYTELEKIKGTVLENINQPFSNIPKLISLETCDMAIYQEFNERFKIKNANMPLILLDMELTAQKNKNYKQFNMSKEFLSGPYFTIIRKESKLKYRSNPSTKSLVAIKSIQTPQGILIEETLATPPIAYDLFYEMKFISNFREYTNDFDEQFRRYFANKRNVIIVENNRFTIGPTDFKDMLKFEIVNRESVDQRTFYVLTTELQFEVFLRDESSISKRVRPNKFDITFDLKESDGRITNIDKYEINAN